MNSRKIRCRQVGTLESLINRRFEELLQDWGPLVGWFSRRQPVAGMSSDDVRQELLLTLWKAWLTYDPTRGQAKFKTYLYVALHRQVIKLRIRGKRHLDRFIDGVELEDEIPAPDDNWDAYVAELKYDLGKLSSEAERTFSLLMEGHIAADLCSDCLQELKEAYLRANPMPTMLFGKEGRSARRS